MFRLVLTQEAPDILSWPPVVFIADHFWNDNQLNNPDPFNYYVWLDWIERWLDLLGWFLLPTMGITKVLNPSGPWSSGICKHLEQAGFVDNIQCGRPVMEDWLIVMSSFGLIPFLTTSSTDSLTE